MKKNILINLSVVQTSRNFGDWKSAIDEAYEFAKEYQISVSLNYRNQYSFIISPTMTPEQINELKTEKLLFGL